ncbi:MAG: AAA family ATPase [Chlamydiales bacterium]
MISSAISPNTKKIEAPSPTFTWNFWGCSSSDEKTLTPTQVKAYIQRVVAEGTTKTVNVAQLAKALSLDCHLPEEIKKCVLEAKYTLSPIHRNHSYLKETISSLIHSFFVALERFLMKLGLIHLFKPYVSPSEIDAKGQDMILLSTIFSTLTTTLIPLLGPVHGGMVIGAIMASLLGLSLLYPLWRPFPTCLPRVENWTEKNHKGLLQIGNERKAVLDQMVEAMISSQPLLLVGKLGVGKTEIIKTLVQAIERGDYPALSGCQVFYVNMADLLSYTDWVPSAHSPLSYLSEAIEGNREKIIFVFDQIHLSCQPSSKTFLSDQLNTMLDRPEDNFPHMIGITTHADFQEFYKTHASFAQRFHRIAIGETSDEETAHILAQRRAKISPEMLVEKSIDRTIVEKTKAAFRDTAVMPKMAISILSRCIQKVSPQFLEERQYLWKIKKQMYELALKITAGAGESEEKAFFILNQMLIPALEEKLIANAHSLGIKLVLDEALVDQVIREEQKNQKELH